MESSALPAAERTVRPPGPFCRRLLITEPGVVEIVAERLPAIGPNEVYARSVITGISHGTEIAWLRAQAAALRRNWDAERRIYTDVPGRDFPVAPGYETVARVSKVGADITAIRVGDLVCLDRPHADGHIVTAATATSGLLPAGVQAETAVFFTLVRVALGAVHDAALALGDAVAVVGLGTVGLLAAQMATLAGAQVIGIDRYPRRVMAAASLGIEAVAVNDHRATAAEVRRRTGQAGADAAIEASGSYTGLHEAIRSVRIGGRVATVASYHGDQHGLRLGEEYHRNRITLVSSMTVNGCPHPAHPAWTSSDSTAPPAS
jgi:threonine dehydrogenase-like Zn-dependent dehydrogenase